MPYAQVGIQRIGEQTASKQKRLIYISVALSDPADIAHNEQKLMPEIHPGTSQGMHSIDDDSLRGEGI